MSDPLTRYITEAFRNVCEAEALIYAAGMPREVKDDVLAAHSALLRLRNRLAVKVAA